MNRWARRHVETLGAALAEGETLLAADRVVMTAVTRDDATTDRGNRGKRIEAARAVGFPVPGPVFVVAITDRRLLLYRASTWLGRAGALAGDMPLESVATVRAVRRLRSERLAILLENRSMLVVQPLWRHRLRDLQAAFESALAQTDP
jgi:hypothetical protein